MLNDAVYYKHPPLLWLIGGRYDMIISFHEPENQGPKMPISLRILGIDHQQEPIFRPMGLSVFQWFYCVRGRGELIINQQRSLLHQGQGALIYPCVPHSYHGLTEDWTVHFFGFTGPNCMDLLKTFGMHESGVYHFSDTEVFPAYIRQLIQLQKQPTARGDTAFSKACYCFLTDLSSCIKRINTAVPIQENAVIQKITDYLEEHYTDSILLDDLASQVQLSKEYMCALFKQVMQQTIMHHLLEIRISRARVYLLQYPEKRVLEVAEMCGFNSPSYFGAVFKKEVGVTPERYRSGK